MHFVAFGWVGGSKCGARWRCGERMDWNALNIGQVKDGGIRPRHCCLDHSSQRKSNLSRSLDFYWTGRGVLGWETLGCLGCLRTLITDSSVGKESGSCHLSSKPQCSWMLAPICPRVLFLLSATFLFFSPIWNILSKIFGCFTLLFYVPAQLAIPEEVFSVEPNLPPQNVIL